MAFDIETSQNQQVGVMQGWLQVWGRPVNGSEPRMAWMAGGQAMHTDGNLMPRMATSDELDQLRAACDELDVLFLQLMIRHHRGGVEMAQYAVDHAVTEPVRTLALSMVRAQSSELATMTEMLSKRSAATLPYP